MVMASEMNIYMYIYNTTNYVLKLPKAMYFYRHKTMTREAFTPHGVFTGTNMVNYFL